MTIGEGSVEGGRQHQLVVSTLVINTFQEFIPVYLVKTPPPCENASLDTGKHLLRSMTEATTTMGSKELEARLRVLGVKIEEEQQDLAEEQRKLLEFEERFLGDTLLEGNILLGWGEPRTAPVRFRNAALRKKKRERQDAAARPALSAEDRERVDRHRLASFSSLSSPAEPIRQRLKAKKSGGGGAAARSTGDEHAAATEASKASKRARK
jgi:hypothetical protein